MSRAWHSPKTKLLHSLYSTYLLTYSLLPPLPPTLSLSLYEPDCISVSHTYTLLLFTSLSLSLHMSVSLSLSLCLPLSASISIYFSFSCSPLLSPLSLFPSFSLSLSLSLSFTHDSKLTDSLLRAWPRSCPGCPSFLLWMSHPWFV